MKTKKILKSTLAIAIMFGSVGMLAGCGNDDNISQNTGDGSEQYKIYMLAVDSGYTGTYEEWLATIKGEKGDAGKDGMTPVITIETDGYWYVNGVSTNIKATGDVGANGQDGSTWLTGTVAPSATKGVNGDFYFDSLAKKIYNKLDGEWVLITTIIDGSNGENGKGIVGISKTVNGVVDTYTITYTDDTTYSFSVKNGEDGAKGEDASEVTFRVNNGYIQWSYVGINDWKNLVSISTLKGETGEDGLKPILKVDNDVLQWKYETEDDQSWVNLFDLSTLNSDDGREIEFNRTLTYIQWRYVGETDWKNLIELEQLKGAAGDNGETPVFRVANDVLQWKYENQDDDSWIDLFDFEDLRPNDGREVEFNKTSTHIQWRYVGESTWNDLVELDQLKGDVGEKLYIQVNDGYIQYKYEGDNEWVNLISLEALKGQDGDSSNKWYTGNGRPSFATNNGDFYIDTVNNDIYLYTNNIWVLQIDLEVNESLLYGTYTNNEESGIMTIGKSYMYIYENANKIKATYDIVEGSIDEGIVVMEVCTDNGIRFALFDLYSREYLYYDKEYTSENGETLVLSILEDGTLNIVYDGQPVDTEFISEKMGIINCNITLEGIIKHISINVLTSKYDIYYDSDTVYNSIENNVSYINDNYYNKPAGTNVTDLIDDTKFYTPIYLVGDSAIEKVQINNISYSDDTISISVGNNNFINKKPWIIKDGQLCVSSLLLKSYALANQGIVLINGYNFEFSQYTNQIEYPDLSNNYVSIGNYLGVNTDSLEKNGDDVYLYSSDDGTVTIRILLGNDESLKDLVAFTVKSFPEYPGQISYGYTTIDKIGDSYYLAFYPSYSDNGYAESHQYLLSYSFVLSNGMYGNFAFDISLLPKMQRVETFENACLLPWVSVCNISK